jgi:hypothetical protein
MPERGWAVVIPFTETIMLHHERASSRARVQGAMPRAQAAEACARLINLSGRWRFISQRLVLFALLAQQGREGALATAQEALAQFRSTQQALSEGEASLRAEGLEPALSPADAAAAGACIEAFAGQAERALRSLAPAALDDLVDRATPLLAALNSQTQALEDLARQQAASARQRLSSVMGDIKQIAKHARIVSFNAQVVAARAGASGREFAVVSGELTQITGRLDGLVQEAVRSAGA